VSATIPLALDGYTDLPPGKIANVVTCFETETNRMGAPDRSGNFAVARMASPDLDWYRALYRRIGERWLWFSRAVMPDAMLRARITAPTTEILTVAKAGETLGFAELNRATPGEVEIAMFGVVAEAQGTGAARFLMASALAEAFAPDVRRVWLHTCTFDHPAAVPFYLRCGFRAFKYALEVTDDPRLTGHVAESAAPHIPFIRPNPAQRA
jgi:GNAT superfamily N-acetyltransferase